MEILFYRYGSICDPDIISLFSSLGLKVITEETEIYNKTMLPSERIKIVSTLLETHQFTFVFSINFFPSLSDICRIFNIPYVCWVVDSPVMELFSKSVQNSCNRIFVFDKAQYQALSKYNPDGIFHLPLATNVSRWDEVNSAITATDISKYSTDISFIGSLYEEKNPYLAIEHLSPHSKGYIEGLINAQSNVYGYNFMEASLCDSVVAELKEKLPTLFLPLENSVENTDYYVAAHQIIGMHAAYIERINTLKMLGQHFDIDLYTQSSAKDLKACPSIHLKGTAKTLTEMPKIFRLSKINLNMTIKPIQTGLSLRVWDIMGAGGFLMCNYQEELMEHFTPGVELEVYSSPEELLEKCQFYLTHEDSRSQIAQKGYDKVKKYHTYHSRVTDMIRTIYEGML